MTTLPFARRIAFFLAVLAFSSLPRARAQDKDRWYVLEMFGGRAGWVHTSEETKDGIITSRSRMNLRFNRADGAVSMETRGEFVESVEGKPISMSRTQKFGAIEMVQTYRFVDDGIDVHTKQGDAESTRRIPLPEGTWLPPAAAERYALQRFRSGAKEITVRTISPETGPTPVTITRRGFERETLEVLGRRIEVFRTQSENSAAPDIRSTEWVDVDGELVRSETYLGNLPLIMILTTREEALAEGTPPAPDAMAATLVKPDKPIHNPRRVRKAVYRLTVSEGELPLLPNTGTQTVEKIDDRTLRVTVDTTSLKPAPEADVVNPAFLRATPICNFEDPKVKELAEAAGNSKSGRDLAEALRRFVYRHIRNKNMDVGFATASEVARKGAGDCSEHGVFLTALLRANAIPARAAAGLIYVDQIGESKGVFGYHMWAQGLLSIDGKHRWVDLDATLPVGFTYDATHITIDTSELDDSDPTGGLARVAQVMGRLRISVESLE
jgi:hypothetical protein